MSVYGPATTFDDMDTMHGRLLLVEVLSDTTRDYDKNEKFKRYQQIPLLRHYLLVEYDRVEVIHHAKQEDGTWERVGTFTDLADTLAIELDDVLLSVPLAEIYRNGINPHFIRVV